MSLFRFSLILLLFGVLRADQRPNFLVILVDDMGYSDLGCYGSEILTPNLDKLAADGIRYTQMYNTSKCYPTRVALLTGNYFQHSDRNFGKTATAGEVLRPAGYHTWWSGKHHANFNPHTRGFDHFSGFLGGAVNFWNPGGKTKNGRMVPGAVYSWDFDEKIIKPFEPGENFHCTDAFTDWALEWITETGQSDKPFFLYLAYNAPHWPLHAHPKDIAKFDGVYDAGYGVIREARYQRQIKSGLFSKDTAPLSAALHDTWDSLSQENKDQEALRMQIHAAMVHQVDRNVGRIVDTLRNQNRLDNTLIYFLADNGASPERPKKPNIDPDAAWGSAGSFQSIGKSWANVCDTPMKKWKATSHEGGINTPMIVHWPAGIKKTGLINREPCHLIDILPTCSELAKAKHPGDSKEKDIPPMEGISLVPGFSGEKLNREAPLFFEFGGGNAIRIEKWKLVRSKGNPWELYDFSSNRTETDNLAKQHPETVAKMAEQWNQWYKRCSGKAYPTRKPNKKKSPQKNDP